MHEKAIEDSNNHEALCEGKTGDYFLYSWEIETILFGK